MFPVVHLHHCAHIVTPWQIELERPGEIDQARGDHRRFERKFLTAGKLVRFLHDFTIAHFDIEGEPFGERAEVQCLSGAVDDANANWQAFIAQELFLVDLQFD